MPAARAQEVSGAVERALTATNQVRIIVTLDAPAKPPVPLAAARLHVQQMQSQILSRLSGRDFHLHRRYRMLPAFAGMVTASGLAALRANPAVARVEVDPPLSSTLAETVPLIRADVLQTAYGLSGSGVTVAVLDSGIDREHPDLRDAPLTEQCFCSDDCCPNRLGVQSGVGAAADDNGHGTHVTSIITGDGVVAATGVAPGAGIVAVKVLDADGNGFGSDLLAALDWILDTQPQVKVVNMSLSTDTTFVSHCDTSTVFTGLLAEVIDALSAGGVAVFAAAGNSGKPNALGAPACVADTIAVGAVDDTDQVAPFSNSGVALDLLAPGVRVRAAAPGGGTATFTGTSQATPHAAGTAALLLEAVPSISPADLVSILASTGVPRTDPKSQLTHPRIDAAAAFQVACRLGPDSDADGLSDCQEVRLYGTEALLADSDGDGLPDGVELGIVGLDADPTTTSDPLNPDSDGDGRLDGDNGVAPCEDCNNNGRVDAGESDAMVAEQFVAFAPGFNLFAAPAGMLAEPQDCEAFLESLETPGGVGSMVRLHAATQRFEPCQSVTGQNFPIAVGEGYVLWVQENKQDVFPSQSLCPSLSLHRGVNLIGHPSPRAGLTCFEFLEALGEDRLSAMQRFNATAGTFETCTFLDDGSAVRAVGVDFPIVAGEAYLVSARAEVSTRLPGCEAR